MIGRLVGQVVQEDPPGIAIVDVGGVGYEVACPVGSLGRASGQESGQEKRVTLFVHTNLRQDCLELFGFASEEDRQVFRLLIAVPNVGPRTALSVLSVLPTPELCEAVHAGDKVRLGKVPGIGKKTAERLVLELRDKLPRGLAAGPAPRSSKPAAGSSRDKLIAALTGMGYRSAEAERAAGQLPPEKLEAPLGEVLREALRLLAP